MTRLLVVANSADGGGAEVSSRSISSELARRGHEVTFIAINENIHNLNYQDIRVINFERNKKRSSLSLLSNFKSFRKYVNEFCPEIIVYNCELPELFSIVQPRGPHIIAVEHTTKPWSGRRILGRFVRFNLKVRGAHWISVSKLGKIWPLGNEVAAVIPNPFVNIRTTKTEMADAPPQLVFIGRLNKTKNPLTVLQLANDLNMSCRIIGLGPEKNSLEEYARENNVSAEFFGYVESPWEFVGKTDLVIIPSDYEGDGMVIMESVLNQVPMLLQDNKDLRKFQLPDGLYCEDFEDYRDKILNLNSDFSSLVPNVEYRSSLLRVRDLNFVADCWEKVISEISYKPISRA